MELACIQERVHDTRVLKVNLFLNCYDMFQNERPGTVNVNVLCFSNTQTDVFSPLGGEHRTKQNTFFHWTG